MTGEKNLTELKIPYVSRLTKVNGLVWSGLAWFGCLGLGPLAFPLMAKGNVLSPNNKNKGKATEKYKSLLLIVRQVLPFI